MANVDEIRLVFTYRDFIIYFFIYILFLLFNFFMIYHVLDVDEVMLLVSSSNILFTVYLWFSFMWELEKLLEGV